MIKISIVIIFTLPPIICQASTQFSRKSSRSTRTAKESGSWSQLPSARGSESSFSTRSSKSTTGKTNWDRTLTIPPPSPTSAKGTSQTPCWSEARNSTWESTPSAQVTPHLRSTYTGLDLPDSPITGTTAKIFRTPIFIWRTWLFKRNQTTMTKSLEASGCWTL